MPLRDRGETRPKHTMIRADSKRLGTNPPLLKDLSLSQRVSLTLSQRFTAARCLFFLAGCLINFMTQGVIPLVGTDAVEGPDLSIASSSEPDLLWHLGPFRQISRSWHQVLAFLCPFNFFWGKGGGEKTKAESIYSPISVWHFSEITLK